MLDWTDRYCRFFFRLLSRQITLYTEMIHCQALKHGDRDKLAGFHGCEPPLVLQLGGSHPHELAEATKIALDYGHQGINLNCGCPSARVEKGAFGAALMRNTAQVKDCLKSMLDQCKPNTELSVKHRLGIDSVNHYDFVRDFVGEVSQSGCRRFIVHARNAWLGGKLNPKQNRKIPPIKHSYVHQLKQDFPDLHITTNGEIDSYTAINYHLSRVDGVMLGRAAYQNPWLLNKVDPYYFGEKSPHTSRADIAIALYEYSQAFLIPAKIPLRYLSRHCLHLFHNSPGAKRWRCLLSDPAALTQYGATVFLHAANIST